MENQNGSANKIALNYGIILGLATIITSVGLYAMGLTYKQDWKMGVLSFLIMAVIIILGIKKYKEANGGFLSIRQGLKTGVGIALVGGVLALLYSMIFMNFIEPDYMEKMMEVTREKMMDNPKFTERMIEQQMEIVEKFSSPAITIAMSIIGSLFFGFVISIFASLVMRKTKVLY